MARYTGPERRKMPRRKTKAEYVLHIDLVGEEAFKIDKAHSADIGGGGLSLYSDISAPLKLGKAVYLIIKLPKRKEEIFALSKVMYIDRIDQGPGRKFKIGFQFLIIDEEDKKVVMDFVLE